MVPKDQAARAYPLRVLMGCVARLTPERRALVEMEFAKARDSGKGDADSAAAVLALLSDSEKRLPSNVRPFDSGTRPSKPPPAARRIGDEKASARG